MTERQKPRETAEETDRQQTEQDGEKTTGESELVRVHDLRPAGYDGTCLRPLGLCDLGGCCDTCWYSPDNPRFKKD